MARSISACTLERDAVTTLRVTVSLLVILFGSLGPAGCAESNPPPAPAAGAAALPAAGTILATADLTVGTNISAPVALAKRVTYVSRSGVDDGQTTVTAAVFQPGGQPPPGGWPVVVYGHPSVGTRPECAPSLSPDLKGGAATVSALLRAGYVVAAPDYQGLGGPAGADSYHPYLDSTTAGYNMIDAVRAARKLIPGASTRWAALGTEQGGQAGWAANELAANYAWDLALAGSASISPLADIDGLADAAGLNREQQVVLAAYLDALHSEYPDDVSLNDYRRGAAARNWDALLACHGQDPAGRDRMSATLAPGEVGPADAASTARLRGYLKKTSLPQGSARAPLLVIYRTDDSLIPADWTARAVDRACRMGDTITIKVVPDHTSDSADTVLTWLTDRFNGVVAQNDCPSPARSATT